jgi:hypothetical protein
VDFDSAIPRFESWRPSQHVQLLSLYRKSLSLIQASGKSGAR